MEKRSNKYQLTLKLLKLSSGEEVNDIKMELQFDNHDELFAIINRLQEKDPFEDKQQAAEFAIGLKMFSEVMLKNRKHPLFEELGTVFPTFIKKVKSL